MPRFFLCYKYFSSQVYLILVTFTVLQYFQVDAIKTIEHNDVKNLNTTGLHTLERSIGRDGGVQTAAVSLRSEFIQTETVRPRRYVEV